VSQSSGKKSSFVKELEAQRKALLGEGAYLLADSPLRFVRLTAVPGKGRDADLAKYDEKHATGLVGEAKFGSWEPRGGHSVFVRGFPLTGHIWQAAIMRLAMGDSDMAGIGYAHDGEPETSVRTMVEKARKEGAMQAGTEEALLMFRALRGLGEVVTDPQERKLYGLPSNGELDQNIEELTDMIKGKRRDTIELVMYDNQLSFK
jgi:hypothetical protein